MARLTSALLLGAAAIGASAHPSRHGHGAFHQKARNEQQVDKRGDYIVATATFDGVAEVFSWAADATTTPASTYDSEAAPVVNAAVTTSSSSTATYAAATSSAASTSGSSSGSGSSSSSATGTVIDSYTSFDDLCASSSKRATKAQIAAVGNTGSTYGCNYALTSDADVAEQYTSYVKFYGATEDMTCYYWNKISSSGGINGFIESEDSWWSFDLSSGDVQYLVIDDGTYGAGTCQPKSAAPATNPSTGIFLYTWVEWTMVDSSTGWSDVDASCIQAELANDTVNGVEVTAEGIDTTSSVSPGGVTVVNGWNSANIDEDGLGVQTSGGLKVSANFGFTG